MVPSGPVLLNIVRRVYGTLTRPMELRSTVALPLLECLDESEVEWGLEWVVWGGWSGLDEVWRRWGWRYMKTIYSQRRAGRLLPRNSLLVIFDVINLSLSLSISLFLSLSLSLSISLSLEYSDLNKRCMKKKK